MDYPWGILIDFLMKSMDICGLSMDIYSFLLRFVFFVEIVGGHTQRTL